MAYPDLCRKIKQRLFWDKILISPHPWSRVPHEGYRINISGEKEEDIDQAKEILRQAQIVFDDKLATSYSETVQPKDRTLRVIHQKSVVALRKIWAKEFEKSRLAQALKEHHQKERR